MDRAIKLLPQEIHDEVRFRPAATNQQQSFNRLMEWRVFLRILHALCIAYGWDLEFDRSAGSTDASCAIFVHPVRVEEAADAWQQAPLLPESFE